MGGQVRVVGHLRALAARHDVRLLAGARVDTDGALVAALRADLGIDAEVFDSFGPQGSLRTWGRALRRGCPPYVAAQLSDGLERRLATAAVQHNVVVALDDYAGGYLDAVRPQTPTVLDKHRVLALDHMASVPLRPRDISERLLARFERHAIHRAAAVVVTSEIELDNLLARYRPAVAISVANEPPRLDVVRAPDTTTVAWMGTHEYAPNHDGLQRFLGEGWDQVGLGAVLTMVGRGPSPSLQLRAADRDDLRVLGFVDDLSAFMASAAAAVVPIWAGAAGAKLKTLTFMEAGVPVVSTAAGLESIDAEAGVHAIEGETPAELAAGLRRLLSDPELAARIGHAGQALVQKRRTNGTGAAAFVGIVEQVAQEARS